MKNYLPLFALALLACSHKTNPEPVNEDAFPLYEPKCAPAAGTICTISGTDSYGLTGDKGPANRASLYWPMDMNFGPGGNLYIVDWNNHRIRKIDKGTGVIDTVAGTDDIGDGPDGPALKSHFNHPTNIAFAKNGSMLIAAWHNSKVKTVDPSGNISDTCGDGRRAYSGDGGPATKASFDLPGALALGDDGTIFIMDQANQRIRAVDAGGTVSNFAGGTCLVSKCMDGEVPEACPGSQKKVCNAAMSPKACAQVPGCLGNFAGDGGPASDLLMAQPTSQAADPGGRMVLDKDGNLFFSDMLNNRVRKIDAKTKIVTTVAGSGMAGFAGDGGDATKAQLNRPSDLAVDKDGTLYIADTFNSCIRKVSAGQISTVAGQCGKDGLAGDGGKPTQALLNRPYGVELAANGDIYVADTYNSRVRVISK